MYRGPFEFGRSALSGRKRTLKKYGIVPKVFILYANQDSKSPRGFRFAPEALDFKHLTEKAKSSKIKDVSSSVKVSTQDMNIVLNKIAKNRKCSVEDAFAAMAIIAQLGGTASKANGDKIKINISDIDFKLELIRKVVKEITNGSFRRIAKTYATNFKEIAEQHGYQGNQLSKIQSNYPEFKLKNEQDKFWVSDFQGENSDCPVYIREQLNTYYREFIVSSITKKKK